MQKRQGIVILSVVKNLHFVFVLAEFFVNFGYFCHFELLLESEKSKEFKIYLKALKSHFKFMDTSGFALSMTKQILFLFALANSW